VGFAASYFSMTKLAALLLLIAPLASADSKPTKPVAKPVAKPAAKPSKQAAKVSKTTVVVTDDDAAYVEPADAHRAMLPAPPASDAHYDTWKKKLTAAQRQQVERFCRVDRPADYEPHCGGIGLYRIPAPPQMIRAGVTQAHLDAWKAGLSRVQRASYEHLCSNEENAYTQLCGGTPLVVAFDNQPVAFTPASSGPDLPTAATPWLALDRDGDGAITGGAELFGDATVLSTGRTAKHGFEALAALDSNGDHRIDRADPMFASLVLWADRDGDRQSSAGELTPAAQVIESIELGYTVEPRCDARLNCEREKSVMRYRDATGAARTGAIVDVYLHHR
jgi:hypothetical protein